MQKNPSRNQDNPMTLSEAALAEEMAGYVRTCAEPISAGETVDQWIARAARRIGISYARARKYWYRDCPRVPALEYLLARRAVESSLRQFAAQQDRLADELRAKLGRDSGGSHF
jgi:hypothetical protein